MAHIIKDRSVVTDPWSRLELNSDGSFPSAPASRDIIVPLAVWRTRREQMVERPGRLGVWLDSHEDPADIAEDHRLFGVVAVNFPVLTDGRGYSIGRLLRERYGYKGELRASNAAMIALSSVTRLALFGAAGLLGQEGLWTLVGLLLPALAGGVLLGHRLHAVVPAALVVRTVHLLLLAAGASILLRSWNVA